MRTLREKNHRFSFPQQKTEDQDLTQAMRIYKNKRRRNGVLLEAGISFLFGPHKTEREIKMRTLRRPILHIFPHKETINHSPERQAKILFQKLHQNGDSPPLFLRKKKEQQPTQTISKMVKTSNTLTKLYSEPTTRTALAQQMRTRPKMTKRQQLFLEKRTSRTTANPNHKKNACRKNPRYSEPTTRPALEQQYMAAISHQSNQHKTATVKAIRLCADTDSSKLYESS